MICGVAIEAIEAPETPCEPRLFRIRLFRDQKVESPPDLITRGETALIANRDPSLTQEYVKDLIFVVAARINYEWVPVWVGCPEQCEVEGDPESCPERDWLPD